MCARMLQSSQTVWLVGRMAVQTTTSTMEGQYCNHETIIILDTILTFTF